MTTQTTEPRNDFKACLEISHLCRKIGGIAEYDGHYSMWLTRTIQKTGKPIKEWTLGELEALDDKLGEIWNSQPI